MYQAVYHISNPLVKVIKTIFPLLVQV